MEMILISFQKIKDIIEKFNKCAKLPWQKNTQQYTNTAWKTKD